MDVHLVDGTYELFRHFYAVPRARDADGRELNNWMTIGQVVGIHVSRACLRGGRFDMTLAGTIARCGYLGDYLEATELFDMRRPG